MEDRLTINLETPDPDQDKWDGEVVQIYTDRRKNYHDSYEEYSRWAGIYRVFNRIIGVCIYLIGIAILLRVYYAEEYEKLFPALGVLIIFLSTIRDISKLESKILNNSSAAFFHYNAYSILNQELLKSPEERIPKPRALLVKIDSDLLLKKDALFNASVIQSTPNLPTMRV